MIPQRDDDRDPLQVWKRSLPDHKEFRVSLDEKKRVKIANRIIGWVVILLAIVGSSATLWKLLRIFGLIQ